MQKQKPHIEPKVSVIIPFYKNVKWLEEAIESVVNQTYKNFEIIVVNDGSDENTKNFLEKYEKFIRYFYKENGGVASARNFGIEKASGEYIAFLDSDDLWKKNKLSNQIEKMRAYNAVWSYTDYEIFGDHVKTQNKRMVKQPENLYNEFSHYIGTLSVIIKRNVFVEKQFKFCEDLKYGEDTVLWTQIIGEYPVLYIPEVLGSVRIRGTNAGRRAASQMIARVKVYDKCVDLIPNYKKTKSLLFKLGIALCRTGCLFVNETNETKIVVEYISRVLYFSPYILFKIDLRLNQKHYKKA